MLKNLLFLLFISCNLLVISSEDVLPKVPEGPKGPVSTQETKEKVEKYFNLSNTTPDRYLIIKIMPKDGREIISRTARDSSFDFRPIAIGWPTKLSVAPGKKDQFKPSAGEDYLFFIRYSQNDSISNYKAVTVLLDDKLGVNIFSTKKGLLDYYIDLKNADLVLKIDSSTNKSELVLKTKEGEKFIG